MPKPTTARSLGAVSPYLINDPVAWTACFVTHDETYALASYTYWNASGDPVIIRLDWLDHWRRVGMTS
jgi:hypothetical protein